MKNLFSKIIFPLLLASLIHSCKEKVSTAEAIAFYDSVNYIGHKTSQQFIFDKMAETTFTLKAMKMPI